MKNKLNSIKQYLIFDDLSLFNEVHPKNQGLENIELIKKQNVQNKDKIDETLLFMTLASTFTSKYEMPIVSPYTGQIPKDIIGFNRITSKTPIDVAPHFFFRDELIRYAWNRPFLTEKKLAKFRCSISLDFSMTSEMSRVQKIYASFINKLLSRPEISLH